MKKILNCFRAYYRKYVDFPKNWEPYGWIKDDMKQIYWDGKNYSKQLNIRTVKVIENKMTGAYCSIKKLNNDLIISFKGTELKLNDIITDCLFMKKVYPYDNNKSKIKVHFGFIFQYKSIRDDLLQIVNNTQFKDIFIMGHGLGGALATLFTIDFQYINVICSNIHLTIFGSPRVGNKHFTKSFNNRVKNVKNYQVHNDFITMLPLKIMGYRHIGKIIKLGKKGFPSIKEHLNYYKYLV